jgi:D-alanyl-D-alanine carboxypeptidase
MNEHQKRPRRSRLVGSDDGLGTIRRGVFIPDAPTARAKRFTQSDGGAKHRARRVFFASWLRFAFVPLALVIVVTGVGVFGYAASYQFSSEVAPIVLLTGPQADVWTPLQYGVREVFTLPDFYAETRDAFIKEAVNFIDADLYAMELRYFKDGLIAISMPILAKGQPGSRCQTPAGLYKIESKQRNYFSSLDGIHQPWSLAFQGNFFIHGWPHYPNGAPVSETFLGGCIRLSNDDAKLLFRSVTIDTPVLVHERSREENHFLYEPRVPTLNAPHYLVADVESGTILASSDINATTSIASVTKLMTALTAVDHINLERSVSLLDNRPTVESPVPRLGERSRVTMHSLLGLLLVESSNEAAEVIAAELGRERFIGLMNKKAESLGMADTVFADPSGLSAGNISSPRDLMRLAQHLHHNRSFILKLTLNERLPIAYQGDDFGTLTNFNRLENIDGLLGGKVGETSAAGQTSLTLHRLTVKGEPRTLVVIILGSNHRSDDLATLVRYVADRFGDQPPSP